MSPLGASPARTLVAGGLALETLAVAAGAVAVAVTGLRGQAADRVGSLVLGLTALALAAGLGAVATGVARGMRWSRSPAVLWQLLQIAVAVPGVPALPWLAVPAVALAVALGAGVLLDAVIPRDA